MTDPADNPGVRVETLSKIALGITIVLLGARMLLAQEIGFGDAEALYAVYALFDQATYVDHPGLVGWLGSWLAEDGGVPHPVTVHRFTAVAASTLPWLGGLAARGAGASWRGVLISVIALLVVPELAVGLFAFTPDLPLFAGWMGALGCAAFALRQPPTSSKAFGATVAAGLCTGFACASKVSGVLLAIALVATWLSRPARPRLKTLAPYAALAAGVLVTLPMIVRETKLGWPMLQHRLVHSQIDFGPSLRNLGGLIGGQLLYLTPVVAIVVVMIAIDLVKRADKDIVDRMLVLACLIPFVALAVLTISSRVAEPHWIAPAYLSLALHLARRIDGSPRLLTRRMAIAAASTAMAGVALVFALVKFPILPKLMGKAYDPKYDIVTDLYAWQSGGKLVESALRNVRDNGVEDVTVVGPHWVICAQVQAHLGATARVGCESPQGDDFQRLHPESSWRDDAVLLYVTDDRFPVDVAQRFPNRAVQGVQRVGVRRGGVLLRSIRVVQLGRMGSG